MLKIFENFFKKWQKQNFKTKLNFKKSTKKMNKRKKDRFAEKKFLICTASQKQIFTEKPAKNFFLIFNQKNFQEAPKNKKIEAKNV